MANVPETALIIILNMLDSYTLFYKIPWVSHYINNLSKNIPITLRVTDIINPKYCRSVAYYTLFSICQFCFIDEIEYPLYWFPEILSELLLYHPNIKKITVKYHQKFRRTSMSLCKDIKIFPNISRLTKINIDNWVINSDTKIIEILKGGNNLRELAMPINVSNIDVLSMISNCKKLKKINLNYHKNISDDIIDNIVTNCPKIINIEIGAADKLSDKTLEHLSKLKLYSLSIQLCVNNNMYGKGLEKLSTLTTLALYNCNLQDENVQNMLKNCLSLCTLELNSMKEITDKSFMVNNHSKYIANLTIENCENIQGTYIVKITEKTNLINLKMDYSTNISSSVLNQILNYSPRLFALSAVGCENIDDYTIENIWEKCPYLSKLNLSYTSVSKKYIGDMWTFCKSLTLYKN